MEIAGLILRWAHILCAIVIVGGLVYQRFMLVPAEDSLDDNDRDGLRERLRARWSRWVMFCIAVLLLSGLTNFALTMSLFDEPYDGMPVLYHILFGLKFIAAMGLFMLASLLSGRREKSEHFRKEPKKWLNLALILALVIVLISGVLRSMHTLPPIDAS